MGQPASSGAFISSEEYLAMERASATKHEYFQGEIFAMSGARLPHNRIVRNAISGLDRRLGDGPCEVLPGDQRVHVPILEFYTYPDVIVVCGEPQLVDDASLDTLLNPTLLIEVLSPSTQRYDRGDKFAFYRAIPTLQQYLLLDSQVIHAELFTRDAVQPARWIFTEATDPNEALDLSSIGCQVPLHEFYRRVTFD